LNHYLNNDISYKEKYQPYFEAGWKDKINQMLRADMETWLIDESLVRSDKLTMAHGLEQRVPFLDKDLVELAFRIPSKYKLNTQTQGKKILKDAVSDLLPDFVLEQKKRGFFSPASKWLRGDLKQMSHEILSSGYCDKTKDIFNWEEVRKILDNHIEHKEYALNTIWSLMTFQVWARNYL
ncbi:asparagine synthase C-terminal domain-containing protein, partial [Patescibacteria group bacterium]|nr:asparagine synthase C-terminal domain-containing protein [Patescibacteria group bacterium]